MDQVSKKTIEVTCAIIENEGCILAAQRSEHMTPALKWEFPGGKVEPGEKPEHCIKREIKEELNIDIEVIKSLPPHEHDYGPRIIKLLPFVCSICGGTMECREHKDVTWGKPHELAGLDWAEADIPVYREYVKNHCGL